MKNNMWDGKTSKEEIIKQHTEEVIKMNLPKWTDNIKCPFCKKTLLKNEIRTVGMKLNARNIGDLSVEFCCLTCSIMDTLYYRHAFKNIEEFAKLMSGEMNPPENPLVEEDMARMLYNNLLEKKYFQSQGENENVDN